MIAARRRLAPHRRQLIRSFEREGNIIRMTQRFDARNVSRFDAIGTYEGAGVYFNEAKAYFDGLAVDDAARAKLDADVARRAAIIAQVTYDLAVRPIESWGTRPVDHREGLRRFDAVAEHLVEGLPRSAQASARAAVATKRAELDEVERKRVDALPGPSYQPPRVDRRDASQYRSDDEFIAATSDELFRAGRDGAAPKGGE